MRFYGELIKARIENVTGALATIAKGLIYFKTDGAKPDRLFIDDGTIIDQIMSEQHLPEARRSTKVQLDDAGTGNEVLGTLPYNKGGTGQSSLVGQANKILRVNSGETGYEFISERLKVSGFTVHDFSLSNVSDAAYTTLIADTGADVIKKIMIFYPDGDPMIIAIGAAASEVDTFVVTPGGQDQFGIEVDIPANSRLSMKLVSGGTTNTTGKAVFNYLTEV